MVIIAEATEHDEQVALAEELAERKDYTGAIHETKKVLDALEPHLPTIVSAAIIHGRSTMTNAMKKMQEEGEVPSSETIESVWNSYEVAQMLDPESEECEFQLNRVANLLRQMPAPKPKCVKAAKADFDVLIVGAGAAGIGTALMLTETFGLEKSRVVMMERGEKVGETFRRWPEEMKFISPSFNQQGWTQSFDLNAIAHGTSPAYSLHTEHPSGKDYAAYLEGIVNLHKLNVRTKAEVVSIKDIGESEEHPLFSVGVKCLATSELKETLTARYIVWAAGEFQYPKKAKTDSSSTKEEEKKSDTPEDDDVKEEEDKGIQGMEHCIHNSTVTSWAKLPGDDFIIIGGYESGCDAAINLSRAGKKCKVLASTPCWDVKTTDPSAELAPYTNSRLRDVLHPGFSPHPELLAPLRVLSVEKADQGGFNVTAQWDKMDEDDEKKKKLPNLRNLVNADVVSQQPQSEEGSLLVLHTPNPPVLCIGFEGSVAAAASHLFYFNDGDAAEDDDQDEMEEEEENENEQEMTDEEQEPDEENDSDEEMEEEEGNGDSAPKGCLAGAPLLTDEDESTRVPGVFLVGPAVSHGSLSFCFVYKFRQRFGVVAKAICEGLGVDIRAAVADCKKNNMLLEDLSCCGDTCGDVC